MSDLNRNHDETEKQCFQALVALMENKPIDECSTSEILEKANVSRSTFYRHYQDKYDLLNKSYELILKDTLFTVPEGVSYKVNFFALYGVLSEYPNFFKHALSSQDPNSLRNYIYKNSYDVFASMMKKQGYDLNDPYIKLLLYGYISGTLEITVAWALGGMKESIETLFKLSYNLMPSELQSIISLNYM